MSRLCNKLCRGLRGVAVLAISVCPLLGMTSCASPPRAPAKPSVLEQTVIAMEQEDWGRADRLIETILPPLPVSEEGTNDSTEGPSVARN